MDGLAIAEAFDVLKQVLFCLSGCVGTVMNQLGFERVEKAFHRRIVPAIAFARHGGRYAGSGQRLLIITRCILGGFKRSSQQPKIGGCNDG